MRRGGRTRELGTDAVDFASPGRPALVRGTPATDPLATAQALSLTRTRSPPDAVIEDERSDLFASTRMLQSLLRQLARGLDVAWSGEHALVASWAAASRRTASITSTLHEERPR